MSRLGRAYKPLLSLMPMQVRRIYLFWRAHKKFPRLKRPVTFSEKITWRILNDRRDILSWTCDKYEMKQRVVELDPSVNVVPTLWYGTDVREIDGFDLPNSWVIKPNRQSSGRVHFQNGPANIAALREKTSRWLEGEKEHIDWLGEWAYSQARSGLLIEPRLEGPTAEEPPVDYKVFVFGGRAQLIQVHIGRGDRHRQFHLDRDWNETGITTSLSSDDAPPPRPVSLELMVSQAENIARDFDFLRVDFYEQAGVPYFGEVTPYPAGGLRKFSPESTDEALGLLWELPRS